MEWVLRVLCISVLTGSCISRTTWNEQYEKELRSDIDTEVDKTITNLLEDAQENLIDLELELAYEKKRDGETENNDCSCMDYVNRNGFGNCLKTSSTLGGLSCYVNLPTTCSDQRQSGSDPSKKYSAVACRNSNVFGEILNANTIEVTTDQHLFEGDVKVPDSENAIPDRARLWPKSPNAIPYTLASTLTESDKKAITDAHKELQDVTNGCLRFEKRTSEVIYLEYFKGSGCWSFIGRSSRGKQQISIGRGCGRTYIVIHETLHALGFFHEQSRSDRDDFVKINFGNIRTGMEGNFRKANTDNLGTDYDFNGIMHYGATAFTKNGLPTIEVLPKYKDKVSRVGNIGKLTEIDIVQLNKLYSCQSTGTGWSTWSNWGACSATCGSGTQTRTRRCNQGSTCTGDRSQSQSCKVKDCGPADCSCMDYVNKNGFGNCKKKSSTLGGLSCYVNLPTNCSDARNSGSDPGKKYSAVACRNGNGWLAWSNWGACSTTCGFGTQTRTRRCNQGSTCTGDSSQSQSCKVKDCGQPGPCNCGMETISTSTKKRSIEISGGGFATPNQYPWMVRLSGCGGTLISNRHVMTAYHCVQSVVSRGNNWNGRTVKVSVHNQNDRNDYQLVPIKTCKFPENTASHDIAILELDESLTFDETIHPACLPASSDLSYINQKAMAMGWGMTDIGSRQSATLKYVELVVARKNGNYLYTHVGDINGIPQDPCAGDSGGPLLHQNQVTKRWTIIGNVYGGGFDCRTGRGANGQGIWSRVTAHLDWIRKVLDEPGTSTCAPTPGPDVDGNWSDWSSWGNCSQSCGGGTRRQMRTCSNPAPQGNGANCVGYAEKIEE
jgi:choriolysin H